MTTTIQRDSFSTPVAVYHGIGMVRNVNTVYEALAFLDGWPVNDSFEPRVAAHLICLSAVEGDLMPEDARKAFAEFADAAGILIREADRAVAA